jgi:hypothetical protein
VPTSPAWIQRERGCGSNRRGRPATAAYTRTCGRRRQDSVNVVFAQLALDCRPREHSSNAAHQQGHHRRAGPRAVDPARRTEVRSRRWTWPRHRDASAHTTGRHCEPWGVGYARSSSRPSRRMPGEGPRARTAASQTAGPVPATTADSKQVIEPGDRATWSPGDAAAGRVPAGAPDGRRRADPRLPTPESPGRRARRRTTRTSPSPATSAQVATAVCGRVPPSAQRPIGLVYYWKPRCSAGRWPRRSLC